MRFPRFVKIISVAVLASAFFVPIDWAQGAQIVGLGIPTDSMDAGCHPVTDDVWDIQGPPVNINLGIGYLINPSFSPTPADFTLHDHVYGTPYVPDPTRAIVTYTFDQPVYVQGIEIIQHSNGITQIEGRAGDSLATFSSLGAVFGPRGDITGSNVIPEGESNYFDFGNSTVGGTYFQFVVRKTSKNDGWASYRAFPDFIPVPEPLSMAVMAFGALAVMRKPTRR